MNLYKFTVNTDGYEVYNGFVIAAYTIPMALETMYEYTCKKKDYIPYYLRSSNIKIECLGKFEPEEKYDAKVLMADYTNA
jgi:hypothetical protein